MGLASARSGAAPVAIATKESAAKRFLAAQAVLPLVAALAVILVVVVAVAVVGLGLAEAIFPAALAVVVASRVMRPGATHATGPAGRMGFVIRNAKFRM